MIQTRQLVTIVALVDDEWIDASTLRTGRHADGPWAGRRGVIRATPAGEVTDGGLRVVGDRKTIEVSEL